MFLVSIKEKNENISLVDIKRYGKYLAITNEDPSKYDNITETKPHWSKYNDKHFDTIEDVFSEMRKINTSITQKQHCLTRLKQCSNPSNVNK